jgi:DNA mismatch repair ATPase MutS
MKTFLMFREGERPLEGNESWGSEYLIQDLELAMIIDAMAEGDDFLKGVCRNVLLKPLTDPAALTYRQDILKDCISNESTVRRIYEIVVTCLEKERRESFWFGQTNPELIVYESAKILRILVMGFRQINKELSDAINKFSSSGFRKFLEQLNRELDDSYLNSIEEKLDNLKFPNGVSVSVNLGPGNVSTNHILLGPTTKRKSINPLTKVSGGKHYTYNLPPRDEAGAQAVAEIRSESVSSIVGTLKEASESVLGYMKKLREEIAFYLGCLNLHRTVTDKGGELCFPVPAPSDGFSLSFEGLYDISLKISTGSDIVSNSIDADGKSLVIITGANRGGKSTFLRSIGQAQLMFQSGIFVPATSFRSDLKDSLFTHFKREEDRGMTMGKLDEELARMSEILDHVSGNSMILFNESFSSTNMREGSEISFNIVSALKEKGLKIFFVTHNYEFASRIEEHTKSGTLFLRAERKDDGTRTYRIIAGRPSETGYSLDLYRSIFNEEEGSGESEGILHGA